MDSVPTPTSPTTPSPSLTGLSTEELLALTTTEAFFAPLTELAANSPHTRSCPGLSDPAWLRLGVTRAMHEPASGRGFLQTLAPQMPCPGVSLFFETLGSARREQFVADVAARLAARVPALALAVPAELERFDLHAGDGHWHAAAAHDAPIDERRWATGHFYSLDLRTHALRHLTLAEGKKEHDMGAIKRLGAECFRLGAPKGRQVLWVWDRAGLDFPLWHHWKTCHGIYFVSRAKENLCLEVVGPARPTGPAEGPAQGVLADELVDTRSGVRLRRVRYQPAPGESRLGEVLELLTTELTLPASVIAWLYARRWEIEKVFDVIKNKLDERKAWASNAAAKRAQAAFLCLAHNLLELLARRLAEEAAVRDQAGERRAARRAESRAKAAAAQGRVVCPVLAALRRPLQLSVKFVRWLRGHWFLNVPLGAALAGLRASYAWL